MKALRRSQCPSMILMFMYLSSAVCAQVHGAPPINSDESWTATALVSAPNIKTNPLHITESHIKSGNRTLHREIVEVFGPESRYQAYLDTETETVQETPTTSRSTVRTYRTDVNGQKILVRVTEEKTKSSTSGGIEVVRTLSDRDANGNFRIVQYEVTKATNIGSNSRATKTTVYVPVANGNVAPQPNEFEQSKSVVLRETAHVPDGWQVDEVRESTAKIDSGHKSTEEVTLRRDSQGKLSPFSRSATEETDVHGPKMTTVDTYSLDLPGVARDGKLHLSERSTTIQKTAPGEMRTEQEVEQLDPGDPNRGLKVMKKRIEIVASGARGIQETKTIEARNTDGGFSVISVSKRESDQVLASRGQIERANKPK